jgi:ABC-2 type transport system ATP-binding protein
MLYVNGLVKRFGAHEVLRELGFEVRAGEVYGLLGGNGAGKSTTVNIIAGLLAPDGGDVEIAGERWAAARRRKIGLATQDAALYPTLTAEEHLRFFGRLYGLRGAELRRRVEWIVEAMGLADYRRAPSATLSGGWRRRLSLGVALVHKPELLLLDEPTAGLDVEARQDVWRMIAELRRQGAAALLTTHLLDEAETLCDRIGIMAGGRLAAQGTLAELRALVPAKELAAIDCAREGALHARARELGIELRDYAGQLTLLLPETATVASLIGRLGELEVRSIALRPVSLLHVYLEVTGARPD